MTILYRMGDFPEAVLGLAFSLACALLIAFACLKLLVGLVTREQYNVTDAPRRFRPLFWTAAWARGDARRERATDAANRGATGGTYLLPAAAPDNLFARSSEPVDTSGDRMVDLSEPVRS